jgi:ABC-2 type transport system ATP-binding protein
MRSILETGATTDVAGDGTPVIVVRDLRMTYGGHEAVQGIDLVVRRGEIFALLGPNGAGKTTTVEILEGHRRRSGGTVSVLGADPESAGPDWRARVGIVLQGWCKPQPSLTVRLADARTRHLDVALALVGDPELIFIDEPTTGFDPASRRSAWSVISGLRDLGKTVFLTTPHMEEAAALADRIAVLDAGRIVATGTPRTLTQGAR